MCSSFTDLFAILKTAKPCPYTSHLSHLSSLRSGFHTHRRRGLMLFWHVMSGALANAKQLQLGQPASQPANQPAAYARFPSFNYVLTNRRVTVPLWRQSGRQRIVFSLPLTQTGATAHDSTTLRRIIKSSRTLTSYPLTNRPQCHKCNHHERECECDWGIGKYDEAQISEISIAESSKLFSKTSTV